MILADLGLGFVLQSLPMPDGTLSRKRAQLGGDLLSARLVCGRS